MSAILVVERPENWPIDLSGIDIVAARRYLTDPAYSGQRGVKVYNLCRSYRYQSVGYYVSLLAMARGHHPMPSVSTMQDLKSRSLVRFISEDLDALVQRSLAPLTSDEFTLSIYFGENLAKRYDRLARALFNLFPSPLLRVQFSRERGVWKIRSLRPIGVREIPESHRSFLIDTARRHFSSGTERPRRRSAWRWDLAILVDPRETDPPSDETALRRFERSAVAVGLRTARIGRDDYGRLGEFDALFIRQTTAVNHHTFRFARRASAEGLFVIDDPDSIVRCTNKVFLAELLNRAHVPTPRTVIVHRDNLEHGAEALGFPRILKTPDGSFSIGVKRVDDREQWRAVAKAILEESDLLIAQEFMPTEFDWRIGVLAGQPLYAARYGMARGHWQIVHRGPSGRPRYGSVAAVAVEDAPARVVSLAVRAARLIGDGLYGVDIKQSGRRVAVVEINDNPNLDAGCEDGALGRELYDRLARHFLDRIESLKDSRGPAR